MSQQTKSDGSGEENSGEEPGLIGQFIGQYPKKQTSRAYRTDLEKFGTFLEKRSPSAGLEEAKRTDILQFLRAESQSVGRSTLRRRTTALKSFFEWLEGEVHREDRPIGEDENVSKLVDSVLEKGPPTKENRGSAEPDRQGPSEGPTAKKKPASDEEPTSAEERASAPDERASDSPKSGSQKSGSSDQADRDEEEDQSTSGKEETYTPTEGPLDIPHWIHDAADEKADDPPLRAGTHMELAEVPGALRHGLGELSEWTDSRFGPDYLAIYAGGDLSVQIRYRDAPSSTGSPDIVAQIEHRVIERVAELGPKSLRSYHTVPEQALWYFRGRSWSMPPVVYELVDFSHAGGQSDKRPTWTSFSTDSTQARYQAAVEVTGAFAKAFGLAKDEEVLVSLGP